MGLSSSPLLRVADLTIAEGVAALMVFTLIGCHDGWACYGFVLVEAGLH